MIKFGESGHPIFRATSPLSRGTLKGKGGGKLSIHFCGDGGTIETVFRIIISVNQLSIYGPVSDLCEEYKAFRERTERLVLAGQSDPLFVPTSSLTKTPTPSTDDPAQEDLLQKYQERVESLSQQNRVTKICTDAGFLKTVGVGQYFMTKDTEEFSQFTDSVSCREYTLPRDEKSSDPKGWIRGNTKIGPVLEVTTSYLQGVEIRIESVNKDNSHSWGRISHGLNKLVTDLIDMKHDDDEQETSETKTEVFAFASRPKAEAKNQEGLQQLAYLQGLYQFLKEHGSQFDQAYPVAKRINTLLRHGELPREEDGAIVFWRLKDDLRNEFWALSTFVWWKVEEHNGRRRRQQEKILILYWFIRTRNSLSPSSSSSFRRNPIDPSLQDNVLKPNISSSTFITSDVQSIYTPSRIHDW